MNRVGGRDPEHGFIANTVPDIANHNHKTTYSIVKHRVCPTIGRPCFGRGWN